MNSDILYHNLYGVKIENNNQILNIDFKYKINKIDFKMMKFVKLLIFTVSFYFIINMFYIHTSSALSTLKNRKWWKSGGLESINMK